MPAVDKKQSGGSLFWRVQPADPYRLTGGRPLGASSPASRCCLLTPRGRRTGEERTKPLLYLADGDTFVVRPRSQASPPSRRGWLSNLRADPRRGGGGGRASRSGRRAVEGSGARPEAL
jgi:hypothetical protein